MSTIGSLHFDTPSEAMPWPEARLIIDWKAKWADDWAIVEDLRATRAEIHAGSVGNWRCQIERLYGRLIVPGQTSYQTLIPYDMTGSWVRLRLQLAQDDPPPQEQEPVTIWVGFVPKQPDSPDNTAGATTERGVQRLVCAGPDRIMEQIRVYESRWTDSGAPQTIGSLGWMPGFNRRTAAGQVFGNRSAKRHNGCYHFGGAEMWTRTQMLEYVQREVLQQYDSSGVESGVRWEIGGQLEALDQVTAPVEMGGIVDARRLVERIVDPRYGVDYVIVPLETADYDGFEIFVFSLLAEEEQALGYTAPANPWLFELDTSGATDLRVEFESCEAQLYDRVELVGKQMILCMSAGDGAQMSKAALWPAALETEYLAAVAASGTDIKKANDTYRAEDRFRDVFQSFKLVPGDWQAGNAWPRCDDDGSLIAGGVWGQSQIRRTLKRLPLRMGYDYSTSPPTWIGASDVIPEFLPPLAVVTDPETGRKVAVDQLGLVEKQPGSVRALAHEWGVRVQMTPNHRLARNHWSGANPTEHDPGAERSFGVDHDTLGVTFAIPSDHRVRVAAELPAAEQRGLGLTKVIEVADAELHLLVAQTIIGVQSDGTLELSPNEIVPLRDDREELKRMLAYAIGRYLRERGRASLFYRALHPAGSLGSMLKWVSSGGWAHVINGPISSVQWDFEQRTTRYSAGQAER